MDHTPSARQQANLDLVAQVGMMIATDFTDPDEDIFADDFVFHFVNPQLAELDGDHQGFDGFRRLFALLHDRNETGFRQVHHSITAYGDELVVAHATNTVGFGGAELDVDAIVVWRVFDGKVHEAWDIPAVNTVRPRDPVS